MVFKVDLNGNVNLNNIYANGDLRIRPQNTLYLNNDKSSGDVHFNTGSSGCNVYIDNGDLITGNINLSGNIQSSNSFNVYKNIITSSSFNKTLGLSNITVATFVLKPYYSNTFTI
jgi:hypothetical protein